MTPESPPQNRHRKRVLLVALGLFLLFAFLIAQFFRIQIVQGDHWTKVAFNQHYFLVKEPFKRGSFFSNTSVKEGHPEIPQPFAFDIQKFHLHADCPMIPGQLKQEVAAQVGAILQLDETHSQGVFEDLQRKNRNRVLVRWIEREDRDAVQEWWLPFAKKHRIARNALFFVKDYQRSYPFGKLLGPVLHTIQDRKDELTGLAIPTGGLELQFNQQLKGKAGSRRLMRSPRNALEMGELLEAPEDGVDIQLTVNHYIQAICEEEVEKGVRRANAKAGWAVMMDPFTGEILALAQYPFFYPENYQDYFNDSHKTWMTKVKAITDAYEPGSTMKPLNLALALEASRLVQSQGKPPLVTPEEKVPTADGRVPGRPKPVADVRPSRYLNLYLALQKSSNIYVNRILERVVAALGEGWYLSNLQAAFGLGRRTGVELPAESPGVLPGPGRRYSDGTPQWTVGTLASLAMGYNLQVTSLQMAQAFSVLANGGYGIQPTLVRKMVRSQPDGSEQVLFDLSCRPQEKRRVLSPEAVAEVVKGMKFTTKQGGSFRADIPRYTQAGKTGTTRKIVGGAYSQTAYFATFVGFAPASQPRFTLLVAIDEPEAAYIPGVGSPYYGGFCAAPVFRDIARRTLDYLGVVPDDPYGYPEGDPRYDPSKADWVEERREMARLFQEWNGS